MHLQTVKQKFQGNLQELTHPHRCPLTSDDMSLYRLYVIRVLYPYYYDHFIRCAMSINRVREASHILDIAGGTGHLIVKLAEHLVHLKKGIMLDLSEDAVNMADQLFRNSSLPLEAMLSDMHRVPFNNNSFDLVYIHDSLHHSNDPFATLHEVFRLSRDIVMISDLRRNMPSKYFHEHLERIEEAFPERQFANEMKQRFIESCIVSYPMDAILEYAGKLGGKLILLDKKGANFVAAFSLS